MSAAAPNESLVLTEFEVCVYVFAGIVLAGRVQDGARGKSYSAATSPVAPARLTRKDPIAPQRIKLVGGDQALGKITYSFAMHSLREMVVRRNCPPSLSQAASSAGLLPLKSVKVLHVAAKSPSRAEMVVFGARTAAPSTEADERSKRVAMERIVSTGNFGGGSAHC